MNWMSWVAPIFVAIVSGIFSYLGVSKTAKTSHDASLAEIKTSMGEIKLENEKQLLIITEHIEGVKKDVIRLEQKQDKHNSLMERTYKLEQKVEDLEKQIN